MVKTAKCSPFRWLCCGRGSVHPEPEEADQEDHPVEPPAQLEADQPSVQPSPPPKHAELAHSEPDLSDNCRYYCPLCMMYYEAVYETLCCGHTICDECALGYMRSASISLPPNIAAMGEPPAERWIIGDTILLNDGVSDLLPNACPFCRETHAPQQLPKEQMEQHGAGEQGFQLKIVLPGMADGVLRSYEDTPPNSDAKQPGCLPGSVNNQPAGPSGPSPLRVGDSLEKMKAKMVPFDRPPPVPSGVARVSSHQDNNTPRGGVANSANSPLITTPVTHVQTSYVMNTPGGEHTATPHGPFVSAEISVQAVQAQ